MDGASSRCLRLIGTDRSLFRHGDQALTTDLENLMRQHDAAEEMAANTVALVTSYRDEYDAIAIARLIGKLNALLRVHFAHEDTILYPQMIRSGDLEAATLACQFEVEKESIEIGYLIDFDRYFATELQELEGLADDGLVELDDEWISVTPRGRLLVRAVCMVFDKYLRAARERIGYSRVM